MGVQFRISPTTIFNMKIILALFGFFLTASSLPAPFPPCFPNCGQTAIQNCQNGQCNSNNLFGDVPGIATSNCVGSQCNQNNLFKGINRGTGIQNCKGSQCNQNNNFGGSTNQNFPGSGKGWPFGKTVFGPQVNCEGSQCNQDNRNKREVMAGGDQERKTFVCAGGVVS